MLDPLKFATFHIGFVFALVAMQAHESFLTSMLEMDEELDTESIGKLQELIQGAAVESKKEAKLEGFLFNVATVLQSELNPTIA